MGFMDDLKARMTARLAETVAQKNPQVAGLVNDLMGNRPTTGLIDLVDQFEKAGLEHLMKSWVGTGQNLPITPQQVTQVLGDDKLSAFAAGLGADPQKVKELLAQHLPQVVDQLTPDGRLPPK